MELTQPLHSFLYAEAIQCVGSADSHCVSRKLLRARSRCDVRPKAVRVESSVLTCQM